MLDGYDYTTLEATVSLDKRWSTMDRGETTVSADLRSTMRYQLLSIDHLRGLINSLRRMSLDEMGKLF